MRRRLLALALPAALAAWPALPSPPVVAQVTPAQVTVRLVSQTPWNTPSRSLVLRIEATNNTATTFEDLSIALSVFTPAGGRIDYEESLDNDPPSLLFAETRDVAGTLEPGETRTFAVRDPLELLDARDQSALYPAKVEVRSADVPLAVLRTPILFVSGPQEAPLLVTTTFVLDHPWEVDPSGVFIASDLERAVEPEAPIPGVAATLAATDRLGANLAVSPLLVEQLERMAAGYQVREGTALRSVSDDEPGAENAARLLEDLASVARRPGSELLAYPYAAPSIPALAAGDLASDIPLQLVRGNRVVERALGVEPSDRLIRPPRGLVDQAALGALSQAGLSGVLLDPGRAVAPARELGFSPVATGVVTAGSAELDGVLPSADAQALLARFGDDPVLGAQATLGELAAIYFEEPGDPRGVALLFGEETLPDPAFAEAYLEGLAASPLLRPVGAVELLEELPPSEEFPLVPRPGPRFSSVYEGRIGLARRQIADLRAVIDSPITLPARLDARILLAEGAQFLRAEASGGVFLGSVTGRVRSELSKIEPPPEGFTVTLASRNGQVPVTIRNLTGYPVRVRVTLSSNGLEFPAGGTQEHRVTGETDTLRFQATARRGGRFSVDVVLSTPDGSGRLSASRIVVRSTVYNRIALVLTIGAALFLLVWWARSILARRRAAG